MKPVTLGTGAYRYEVVDQWAKLPPGREFNADVAAVGVDTQDRVYAFNRGQPSAQHLLRPRRGRRAHGAVAYGFGRFSRALTAEAMAARFHGNDERIDVESLSLTTQTWLDTCELSLE